MRIPAADRFGLLARNRDFAALWGADVASTLGDRVHRVALAALIYELTGSLTQTGLAFVAVMLPDLVLGLAAGVFVDRHDRRRVMVGCDLLRIPLVLALPLVAFAFLPAAYILLFVINSLTIVFRPAQQALIPVVVPTEELSAANAISQVSGNVSDIIGYPLGGLVVGVLGAWLGTRTGLVTAFSIDSLSFLISALLVLTVRVHASPSPGARRRSITADLREGFAFLRKCAVVRANTFVMLLGPLTLGAETPLLIGYAWGVLDRGSWAYGLLGFGISLGSILGGIVIGTFAERLPGYIVVAGLAVMGLAIALVGAVANRWLAVLAMALCGVGNVMVLIPSVTLVQRQTPPELLGRIFSLRTTLIFGVLIASNAVGGWAGQVFGTRQTLIACGSLLLIAATLASFFPVTRTMRPSLPLEEPAFD